MENHGAMPWFFILQKIIAQICAESEKQMKRNLKSLIALGVTVIVIAVLAIVNFTKGEDFSFANSLWAILPPVVAICLALITKEVYSSLFVGILTGALMSANFSFSGTMDTIINDGLISSVSDTAGIFVFLVILGVMVALILGLADVPKVIYDMAKPSGVKKICYNHLDIPLVAVADIPELAKTDALWTGINEILQRNGGVWCVEAEKYLLENAPRIS